MVCPEIQSTFVLGEYILWPVALAARLILANAIPLLQQGTAAPNEVFWLTLFKL